MRDVGHENFAVADLVGFCSCDDRFDGAINLIIGQNDLDLNLWKEVDDVFSATIKFSMAFLATKTFDLYNAKALNACVL